MDVDTRRPEATSQPIKPDDENSHDGNGKVKLKDPDEINEDELLPGNPGDEEEGIPQAVLVEARPIGEDQLSQTLAKLERDRLAREAGDVGVEGAPVTQAAPVGDGASVATPTTLANATVSAGSAAAAVYNSGSAVIDAVDPETARQNGGITTPGGSKRSKRSYFTFGGIIFVLVVAIIIAVVLLGGNDGGGSNGDNGASGGDGGGRVVDSGDNDGSGLPTTSTFEDDVVVDLPPLAVADLIAQTRSNISVLDDPESPQSLAWDYLVTHFQNEIENGSTTSFNVRQSLIETFALTVIYFSTGGPEWTSDGDAWVSGLNGNDDTEVDLSPCNWSTQTVTCDNPALPNRVSKISLSFNNLVGSIPPEIILLTDLTSISLCK